jgi:polar amino acid transport system permease protein
MKMTAHTFTMKDVTLVIKEPNRPGRVVGILIALIFISWVVYQILTNRGFQWDVVGRYLFHRDVIKGVVTTVVLTLLVMIIGMVTGTILGIMSISSDRFFRHCASTFVWFFRGSPVLVQLVFWYNLAALFPILELGIPFGGAKFFEVSATLAISSFTAALLGLGLCEGAYMCEIIRSGLLSVDPGQREASQALGHKPRQTFFIVILPQAMKAIIPPTGNQVIGMLKYTSIASVVALPELMHSVETIYSRTFETVPLLIVASIWYLTLVTILSCVQFKIEQYYAKGTSSNFRPQLSEI